MFFAAGYRGGYRRAPVNMTPLNSHHSPPARNGHNATILDIAREVGVSAMTVSRALRDRPEVHPRTRARIIGAAQQMGYRPNRWARSLVNRRSWIIGIVIPDISHGYFAEITGGIEPITEAAGYDLLLCHSRRDAARERQEINMLLESRVDGLIVASEQEKPEHFRQLLRQKTPFVLIDRIFTGLRAPSVRVDDALAGRMATEYLIRLGHRRIAYLRGPRVSTSELRFEGYRQALRQRRLPLSQELISSGAYDIATGDEAMRKLLRARPRPTAVFAANDPMAFGAIMACKAAGLSVPGDISIIGAGNVEGDDHPNPFLTTMDWPRHEFGGAAAKLLLRQMSDPGQAPKNVIYKPKLLVRQTTAAPRESARRP